jgi:MFS family permease
MIFILWFSACNFITGFSPNFAFLFVVRAILGIGMGAERSAGATLAMESWPARSRGLMSGVLQGSWGLGFALSSVACWLTSSAMIVYYSINGLAATWLQQELQLTATFVARPILFANLIRFAGTGFWGAMADRIGRRWSMIIRRRCRLG